MMQAINSVEKGVHLSNEMALQPIGSLRRSVNGRITSLENGNYAWETIGGNVIEFTVGETPAEYNPIGYIETHDHLYIFSATHHTFIGSEIGRVDSYGVYTPFLVDNYELINSILTLTGDLNFSQAHRITGYFHSESATKENLYFNDEYNRPRWFNTANIQVYPYGTVSTLVRNETYTVVQGEITVDSVVRTRGFTFEYTYSTVVNYNDPQGVLSKTIHVSLLDFSPDMSFAENVELLEKTNGTLEAGSFYLAYRYRTKNGFASEFSPLTIPYSIYSGPPNNDLNTDDTRLWYQVEPGEDLTKTDRGLRFRINNIDTRFEYIDIIAFRTLSEYTLSIGRIIKVVDITAENILVDAHNNYVNFNFQNFSGNEITFADYAIASVTIDKSRDLDDIKNYNCVGSITEEPEVSAGASLGGDSDVKPGMYSIPLDVIGAGIPSGSTQPTLNHKLPFTGLFPIDDSGSVLYIIPEVYYKVISGTIAYPQGTTSYTAGDVFKGIDGEFLYTPGAGSLVTPVIHQGKYYSVADGEMIYEDIPIFDAEGYRGIMQSYLRGYWGKERYRIGILPLSLTGKPMYVRHVKDIDIPARERHPSSQEFNYLESDGTFTTVNGRLAYTYDGPDDERHERYCVGRIANLLVDVDLTDIIDEISGFCIVRCEREKSIISEGIIESTVNEIYAPDENTVEEYIRRTPYLGSYKSGVGATGQLGGSYPIKWQDDTYFYISPDQIMDPDYKIGSSDYIQKTHRFMTTQFSEYRGLFSFVNLPSYNWKKYMDENYTTNDKVMYIKDWYKIEAGEMSLYYHSSESRFHFNNVMIPDPVPASSVPRPQFDFGNEGILIEFSQPHSDITYRTPNPISDDGNATICEHVRPVSNPYGGDDPYSLESSKYKMIGHYQKVDDTFKARIKNGSKYVAKNIQIFGGDTYITPFSQLRMMPHWQEIKADERSETHGADLIVVPLQSNINPLLRDGRHAGRDGIYVFNNTAPSNTKGVGFNDGNEFSTPTIHTDNSFNKSYLPTKDIDVYPGLPVDFDPESATEPSRVRYTKRKTLGEQINNYIIFPPLNYVDIPGFGEIVNIRELNNRLMVWKDDAILYIPVDERAMMAGDIGSAIQLGLGSSFTRSDEVEGFYGNQHRTGLTKIPGGYVWFDNRRKAVMIIDKNGGMDNLSLKLGWENFFRNNISDRISRVRDMDNYGGILSDYDEKTKTVYISLLDSTNEGGKGSYTVGYNIEARAMTGNYDPVHWFFARLADKFFTSSRNSNNVYSESRASDTIYGESFQSIIQFIICGELQNSKRFYSHVARGSKYFFDQVTFKTLYDHLDDTFSKIITENVNAVNDYEYLNGEWRFGTPDSTTGRFEDIYMLVEFMKNSTADEIVRLYQLLTHYIKLH